MNAPPPDDLYGELLNSLEGMLESYDLLIKNRQNDPVFLGVIRGWFIGEPEKARAVIAKAKQFQELHES